MSKHMDSDAFRLHGKDMVEFVARHWETMRDRKPLPDVKPGYLKEFVPCDAPHTPEDWDEIFGDLEQVVMSGNTYWHHPHFFAYFPTSCSYPSIIADILSGGLGSVGFTWKSGPALTELEMATMDWLVTALGLPEHFKNSHAGPGCGIIQSTASDATLIAILAARARAVEKLAISRDRARAAAFVPRASALVAKGIRGVTQRVSSFLSWFINAGLPKGLRGGSHGILSFINRIINTGLPKAATKKKLTRTRRNTIKEEENEEIPCSQMPHFHDSTVFHKFIAYCSDQAHSSVEKGVMLSGVKLRKLKSTIDSKIHNFTVTAETLEKAIKEDRARGLIPFVFVASMGSTNTCGVDFLTEIGPICNREGIWLHVDAAYAGAYLLCEEYRYMSEGVETVDSFNFNAHKAMLVNFDCSPMWFKDGHQASRYFTVDALYLKNSMDNHDVTDYSHLQIALGSRFRALKIWFVMRSLGVKTIQEHLRWLSDRAVYFARLIETDRDFELFVPPHLGLACFRLVKGGNKSTEALLAAVNADNRIHIVPSSVHGKFFLRLAVCTSSTTDEDIRFAFGVLKELAQPILWKL